jgi:hypothetical protein
VKIGLVAVAQVILDWVGFQFLDEARRLGQSPMMTAPIQGYIGLFAIIGATVLACYLFYNIYKWVKLANQAIRERQSGRLPTPVKKQPELVLEPLPHYKGWPEAPPLEVAKEDLETAIAEVKKGPVVRRDTQPHRYTTSEASQLEQSQYYVLYGWRKGETEIKSLVVSKFGVIKVRCKSGEVFKLKASIRSRPMVEDNTQANQTWVPTGYLNWYSEKVRLNLSFQVPAIQTELAVGLNRFLLNTELEHLGEGEEAELLLFYMIQGFSNVILCTDLVSSPIGRVTNGNPLIFEVEIKLSGQGYTGEVWKYQVTALWDDFRIDPI